MLVEKQHRFKCNFPRSSNKSNLQLSITMQQQQQQQPQPKYLHSRYNNNNVLRIA